MQFNTRTYGKFATGAKYAVGQEVYTPCGEQSMYVGDVVQHRDKVFVEVCPQISDMLDWDADILALVQPLLAALGLTVTSWDGGVYGQHDGGCFILLK